jgi:hypothetical protein
MSGTNVRKHTNGIDADAAPSLTNAISTMYDWANVEPTTAVVETTAAVVGRKPTDLDILHDVVDTSALNAFLQAGQGGDDERRVSFDYNGCTVIARQNGRVTVVPVDA